MCVMKKWLNQVFNYTFVHKPKQSLDLSLSFQSLFSHLKLHYFSIFLPAIDKTI